MLDVVMTCVPPVLELESASRRGAGLLRVVAEEARRSASPPHVPCAQLFVCKLRAPVCSCVVCGCGPVWRVQSASGSGTVCAAHHQ